MGAAQKVNKSGYNAHQKYKYVMESDLLEALRSELINQGVFIFQSVEDIQREGELTTVKVKYTFVDSESGESFEVWGAGQGADKQDKGVGKAQTNAQKYVYLKNFLIETGDDVEADNIDVKPSKTKTVVTPQVTAQVAPEPKFNAPTAKPSFGTTKPKPTFGATTSKTDDTDVAF